MIVGKNNGLADVITSAWESGHDDLRTAVRLHLADTKVVPQHTVIRAEVQAAVAPRQTASAQARTELSLLIGAAVAVVIAESHDPECRLAIARTVDRHEDVAIRHDRHMASRRRDTIL